MNIIETIKAEIERLKNENNDRTEMSAGARFALNKLLAKLDTLKEQPVEVHPLFRVGDYVRNKTTKDKVLIEQLDMENKTYLYFSWDGAAEVHSDFSFSKQDEWELIGQTVPDKQALCEQKPAEHLSVRDDFDLEGNLKTKSAGWSDEDEGMLGSIIRLGALDNAQSYWLKRICSILRQQKPAEWSEEDKKYIQKAIECAYSNGYISVADFLKNLLLQPRREWSEEEEGIIQQVISHLQVNGLYDLANRLKSLRPHWKPSKEQMEELNKARRFIPYNCDTIESLYKDLLKR